MIYVTKYTLYIILLHKLNFYNEEISVNEKVSVIYKVYLPLLYI